MFHPKSHSFFTSKRNLKKAFLLPFYMRICERVGLKVRCLDQPAIATEKKIPRVQLWKKEFYLNRKKSLHPFKANFWGNFSKKYFIYHKPNPQNVLEDLKFCLIRGDFCTEKSWVCCSGVCQKVRPLGKIVNLQEISENCGRKLSKILYRNFHSFKYLKNKDVKGNLTTFQRPPVTFWYDYWLFAIFFAIFLAIFRRNLSLLSGNVEVKVKKLKRAKKGEGKSFHP